MEIIRDLTQKIEARLGGKKAIILIGPRQVGKTTLINALLKGREFLFLNCDDPTVKKILDEINTAQLKNLIANYKTVFIDEAQRIENIGITLKLITDQFKDVQLIVSGSSALEIGNKLNEPLTGRKWQFELWPVSWKEFENTIGFLQAEQQLELRIIYGMYPDVINHTGEEKEVLREIASSYLYKDLLTYNGIRKPHLLEKLLQALAIQIGHEVSYTELAGLLGVDKKTISTYIELLEQAFVIFRLGSFARNLRNEIKTNQKIYFIDTGIRNAVIGNYTPLNLRTDKGALWENFLLAERMKKLRYENPHAKPYFWRTVQQQEIDYVEEADGKISAFEIKWGSTAKMKTHLAFKDAYQAELKVIHKDNFREFL